MEEQNVSEITAAAPTDTTVKDRSSLGWFSLGAVVGAVIAVAAMVVITAARTPSSTASVVSSAVTEADANWRPFAPRVAGRPANTQGDANAAITVIEYSDFNCGFCKRFHDETFQRVIDDYVKTGKVKFSYKHYPFLAASSSWKAEAAECAAEQGQFWEYHDALFLQKVGNQGEESAVKQALIEVAAMLEMDEPAFAECLKSGAARQRVQDDASEAQRLGVTGTPSFLVNGKPIVGAQPYEVFKQAIDAELTGRSTP
jgi:protein-disulfide isomerase